jgi:Flp pilus assembly pilin Flp
MKVLGRAEYRLRRRWQETTGQDLIEYALMAGFVAVAAGAILPPVATSISTSPLDRSSGSPATMDEPVSGEFLPPEAPFDACAFHQPFNETSNAS